MSICVTTVAIRYEHDVVLARQRARQLAERLGFDTHDQVRIATAVSEIARNAFLYAKQAKVEFLLSAPPARRLEIRITDQGPGIPELQCILDGRYKSSTGMGLGILGARKLMDEFTIQSASGQGTTVLMSKPLPAQGRRLKQEDIARLSEHLARETPQGPFTELQKQNQELLAALSELERRQAELAQLNKELEDTNRGVVALYAELDEKADYLRRASELKSQFLSNMTHEFRTPLNSILSLSRILLDRVDGELGTEQERQVHYIQRSAQDLSDLVNDLLDLAKVEAGKTTVRPIEFQVGELFGALRGMLRPLLAHNSSVTLHFDEPAKMSPLQTDESKVSQILRNLISNALKYTERGEVRVSAWMEPEQMVTFAVSDTGIGIALADQERIFEEYAQIEGPHQAGKRGTGLGLPLSRRLAELLGGTVTVQSELGAGSTFTLRLPLVYDGPTEVSVAPELPSEIDSTRLPVLLVEDNRETLFIYEKYFKGTGFQPIPARTLKQARQILGQCRPVAVILDILLANEQAWTFVTELKGHAATRDLPVYVVTVLENRQKALALGADGFHTKPIDRQWLLEKLHGQHGRASSDEVLVIDDDEASRYVLKGFLGNTRFRVVEAANAYEGIRLARERKPAAIFLDLILPDLNGFETLDLLRSDPATQMLPVIVHTGKILTEEEHRRLAPQVTSIIPKTHTDRAASLKRIREALFESGAGTSAAPSTPSQSAPT